MEVIGCCLQGLEPDHHFCLNFDSLFVVILVPYLLILTEVIHILVEISAWKGFTTLFAQVVRLSVVGVDKVVVVDLSELRVSMDIV